MKKTKEKKLKKPKKAKSSYERMFSEGSPSLREWQKDYLGYAIREKQKQEQMQTDTILIARYIVENMPDVCRTISSGPDEFISSVQMGRFTIDVRESNSSAAPLEVMVFDYASGKNLGVRIPKQELYEFTKMKGSERQRYGSYLEGKGVPSIVPGSVTIPADNFFYTIWDSGGSAATSKVIDSVQELSRQLKGAQDLIEKQNKVFESIKKEPLLLSSIDRISRDKKHAFIKKGDQTIRVEVVKDLEPRDEVLLHPKTMQIVERIGKPPLEVSRFAPDTVPNVTWNDIGGLEIAKRDMIEAIEMPHKHKELFSHYNKKPVKGILLAGPPGCGKTLLGKAAANSLSTLYGADKARTGFLYVKGPEILNMYVGASEETIRDLFYDARRHHEEHGYPAIIFIDEADAVMGTRGSRFAGGIGNTIVPMFLTEMDGLEASSAIVILATNRPDILDPAIVREGRIDRKIMITRPKLENAKDIILMNLKRYPVSAEFDLHILAEDMAAEFFSDDRYVTNDKRLKDVVNGAMLATCIEMAVSSAIHRDLAAGTATGLVAEDLLYAIDRIQQQNRIVTHDLEKEVA